MGDYALNKIFVEGETDKIFIDALLKKHLNIVDPDLVISTNGKDNLIDSPIFIDGIRKKRNVKNIILFDTDYLSKGGGRETRLKEYLDIESQLGVLFKIYLFPNNDETEGEVEDIIKTCFNKEFDSFDNCWSEMLMCFKKKDFEKTLNIPAKEGFLFSKIDLFKNYRQNQNWNYSKLTKYDYSDSGIWNLEINENPILEKLVNFIKNNLFN